MKTIPALGLALCLCAPSLEAEGLGGGRAASHGRVPLCVLDSWIPNTATRFRLLDLPTSVAGQFVILGDKTKRLAAGSLGTLVVDLQSTFFQVLPVPSGGLSIPVLPKGLEGAAFTMQGLWFEPSIGLGLTDGTRVDLFTPLVMVGNSRQSSNSISVIDLPTRSVKQRLTNSENGYIEFSPDRTRGYVCEPGLQRNRVVVYDLTKTPIPVLTTVPVSGGIRYGGSMPRDGKRLYVPVHDGVSVIDTDPTSTTYHREIQKLATAITGNSASIFTGPLHTAVTPDGKKLYVAFGESQAAWPSKGVVSVFDLTKASPVEKTIPVTNGGIFTFSGVFSFVTRPYIEMSHTGLEVYVLEWGVNLPAFTKGFANGSVVNVISTILDREMAVVPTGGFDQEQIGIDRLDRGLWVAQLDRAGTGQIVRIDVGRHSTTRYKVTGTFTTHPNQIFTTGSGPRGIDVSADGSRVFVSSVERAPALPEVLIFDAVQDRFETTRIRVESLCHTVSVQKW